MLRFEVPEYDKAKVGRRLVALDWCHSGIGEVLGYIQVTPMTFGDLDLAHKIAALPDLIAVCEEVAKSAYPDTDPPSLLETLRARAESALRLANKPLQPELESSAVVDGTEADK